MNIILTRVKNTEISLDLIHASKVIVGCAQRHNTTEEDVIPSFTIISPPTLRQGVKGFLVSCEHGRWQTGREYFTNFVAKTNRNEKWIKKEQYEITEIP